MKNDESTPKSHDLAPLYGITGLLIFQLIGEIIVRFLNLALPGPVFGMILLLLFFGLTKHHLAFLNESIHSSSTFLLRHLSLLFVPAGVGLIAHMPLIKEQWLVIAIVLILGGLVTLLVTALSMKLCFKLMRNTEKLG